MKARVLSLALLALASLLPGGVSLAEEAPPPPAAQAPAPDPGGGKPPIGLFTIRRSTNANEVVYEARTAPGGGFDPKNPLKIYWVMKTKGGAIEGLTPTEQKMAYGVDVKRASADEFTFTLKAIPDRVITVRRTDEKGAARPRAFTLLKGEECALDSVFIVVKEGGPIPKVKGAEVTGTSRATGKLVMERIAKKVQKGEFD